MRAGSARATLVLLGLSLSTFAFVTAEALPIGLLSLISRDLGTTPTAVGLLVSAYALVVVVTTIPLVRLTARVPRRTLLALLLVVLVVGTGASAVSHAYWALLVARLVTAAAQAVFWAVVLPIAAGLVPAGRRGRAVSTVYAGSSLGIVLGVPLGTWVGQVVDWRTAFAALALVGVGALVVVAALLPASGKEETAAVARGSAPDRGRYRVLVVATALIVTASLSAYTYVDPFLLRVTHLPAGAIGGVLLLRGAAGLLAVLVVGRLMDAAPRGTMVGITAVLVVALAAQWSLGALPWAAVASLALSGAATSAYSAAVGARVLAVAPGSVDLASAGTSTSWNGGILLGSLLGGLLLPAVGAATLPLVAAVVGAGALAALLLEPRLAGDRALSRAGAAG